MSKDKRPQTFDHLKSAKQPTFKKCYIVMDSDTVDKVAEAEKKFAMAQIGTFTDDSPKAKADFDQAEEELDKVRKEAKDEAFEFVFRSIGRKRYDDLVIGNPPTEKDKVEISQQGGDPDQLKWSPDTFPVALIAAASYKPELTFDQVKELWDSDDWTAEDLGELFNTAIEAQQVRRVIQLGNA